MRIATLIDTLTWGGAEKTVVTFAEIARARQIDFTVIALYPVDGYHFANELTRLGTNVVSMPASKLFDRKRLSGLVRFLRQERFDVLHTQLTYANILGTIAGRLAGIPVVSSLHNIDSRFTGGKLWMETAALRYGMHGIAAAGYAIAEANQARLGRRPIQVIPNSIEPIPPITTAERQALRRELVGDPERPLLIAVGSLTAQKAHHDLIEAFAIVQKRHPTAALVIAGKGPLRRLLQDQIDRHRLNDAVKLLGVRNDVPKLLAAADIFTLASHWEGLPIAVLEAMSAGLPIVMTDVADLPRLVVPGTGYLVPPHMPAKLAARLTTLIDDAELRQGFGEEARKRVLENHNADHWADQLIDFYRNAVGTGRRLMISAVSR